jgi:hypothetical protein
VPDDRPTPLPRLPDSLGREGLAVARRRAVLRAGCHLLRFMPRAAGPLGGPCDGTLRVEQDDDNLIASGDLYLQGAEPEPSAGVPVFARSGYQAYLRVTHIGGDGLTLGFELYGFDHSSNTWLESVELSGHFGRALAPADYPSRGDFLRGEVRDAGGGRIGNLTIGWVSPHLRRAVIELDRVADSETPLVNAAGLGWSELFESIGWHVTVEESDLDVVEPSGESWSDAELHAEMLRRRTATDLDREWRYWLVSVRRLDGDERGLMFDRDGGDSNNIPREAAGIASHWQIPNEDPWGLVRGMRFGSASDLYFRTAAHEIGHAMGLVHNDRDEGIMCPTRAIADRALPPQRFPENVLWSYTAADQHRLRHLPDHWVRPGGVPFGAGFGAAPRLPNSADAEPNGFELTVSPLLSTVPLGAPVRVEIALRNTLPDPVPAPANLSLKAGNVRGRVTDPSGTIRSFGPLVRHTEPRRLEELAKGEVRTGSLTLLRGVDGALFPSAGDHAVEVIVEWESQGVRHRTAASRAVAISPAVDEAHAEAAQRINGAPDVLITLALGGDHLASGVEAIRAALANAVLKPHFAYVEAKRLASDFQQRPADLAATAELIDAGTVMSPIEIDKAAHLVEAAAKRGQRPPERLVAVLRERARGVGSEGAAQALNRL